VYFEVVKGKMKLTSAVHAMIYLVTKVEVQGLSSLIRTKMIKVQVNIYLDDKFHHLVNMHP
jgi:hypothetical protein